MEESNWTFHQVFGDRGEDVDFQEVAEADIISAVEFDHSGEFLATGDKGGRIVLFQRESSPKKFAEYYFYTEFQSHEPEFDYLKSLEIEEKVNKIKWVRRQNRSRFLLSTNDKTIKLWKIYERQTHTITGCNTYDDDGNPLPRGPVSRLAVPKLVPEDKVYAAVPRRVFANAHAYHINSISINSDDEVFLSADDLRINLWNMQNNKETFMMVDIKPTNMEELTEVITAAEFHPTACNLFMYSSSKGTINLADMRDAALCDRSCKVFEEEEDPANKSFFSEIISSISDVRFSHDGRYIMSRDYLNIKIWDINMERQPVATYPVHDYLKSKLVDLYENDCIFDKFECAWSGDDRFVMTGSYQNMFNMIDRNTGSSTTIEARTQRPNTRMAGRSPAAMSAINVDNVDYNWKVLHSSFHPRENMAAIAATNNLFLVTNEIDQEP